MGKSVQVKQDYVVVLLPDGKAHNEGDIVALTDAEYAGLPVSLLRTLVLLGNIADPVRHSSKVFQMRRGTEADWAAENPILVAGEPGYETDTMRQKVGDGVSGWVDLPYTDAHLVAKGELVINVRDYGAIGDGVADDTQAVRAACDAANALVRPGLEAGVVHPGATVLVTSGVYNLATLAAPIDIICNLDTNGAGFVIPAAYAGVAMRIGGGAGAVLQNADIALPDVIKPIGSPIVASSVGARVRNLLNSRLALTRIAYFECGIHLTGDGSGTSYNTIDIGQTSYCKVGLKLQPDTPGAFVNQNVFVAGGISQSLNYAGGSRVSGWRHLVLDSGGINPITGNTFVGVSFEGDASEFTFEIRGAHQNTWIGCRHGDAAGITAGISEAIVTRVDHGLVVNDMVVFANTVDPGGLVDAIPYFVVAVLSADTFSVGQRKSGPETVFTSPGSGVTYFRPQRIYIDATVVTSHSNTFDFPQTPLQHLDVVTVGGVVAANTVRNSLVQTLDNYTASDLPLFRARNRAGTRRPLFAAYPINADPVEDPSGWTTALSDRGVTFANASAELGVISDLLGSLTYRRPDDEVAYEIASCRRTPELITVTGLLCPKRDTKRTTVALAGATVNDHVLVTMLSHVDGIVVSHAFVSSADTVRLVFGNVTNSDITLTANFQLIAFRRYY